MTILVVVVCGVVAGGGLLLIVLGLSGPPSRPDDGPAGAASGWAGALFAAGGPDGPASSNVARGGIGPAAGADQRGVGSWWAGMERRRLRLGLAASGGIAMWLFTGWPVGGVLAVVAGLLAPSLVGAKRRRDAVVEQTEAIAGWAEQLRDTISAAAGLQEAIATTARVAPIPIRPAVVELAAGIRRSSLATELHRFAERLADPIADQVAVALLLAAERRGDDLSRLLDDLAEGARADATMRIRTETSRAQTYNDAKVVTGVVVGMFAFMLLVNRHYLDAFDTWAGQAVLAVVGSLWLVALFGITTLSQVRRPPRLLSIAVGAAGTRTRGLGR